MAKQRDFTAYGRQPPAIQWPNKARLAVSFVINYEEGGESNPLDGDLHAQTLGAEFPLHPLPPGQRHLGSESLYEYGSRVGVWRLIRLFDVLDMPVTFFAVGLALQRNPLLCDYLRQSSHEVAGHGWRWIDYSSMPFDEEKAHIKRCIALINDKVAKEVSGWYTGKRSSNTRSILMGIDDILYDSDSYADDIPYYQPQSKHLIIPYNLDCNDFRFTTNPGFVCGEDFLNHLKASFNMLYAEGIDAPKMMSIGLHPRIGGRPGRAWAIEQFLNYINTFDDVWITTRQAIAQHWLSVCPP